MTFSPMVQMNMFYNVYIDSMGPSYNRISLLILWISLKENQQPPQHQRQPVPCSVLMRIRNPKKEVYKWWSLVWASIQSQVPRLFYGSDNDLQGSYLKVALERVVFF